MDHFNYKLSSRPCLTSAPVSDAIFSFLDPVVDNSFLFSLAKPVHSLALRVFQRYYAELCTSLSEDPHQIAREMFSKELIGEETMRRVVEMPAPFLDKAGVLVQAIQNRIASENSSNTLMVFCQVLKRRPVAGSVAARMKARLGE